jgi:hypothetical protein
VAVAGVVMHLELVSGRGGSLVAKYFTRDVGKALAIAGRLESAGLRPNVVRSGPNYVVYIATADLLRLAERDGEIRRAIALYLAEKVKNGTPRQREIAEKILKRHPLFLSIPFCLLKADTTVGQPILNRNAELVLYVGQQQQTCGIERTPCLDRNRDKLMNAAAGIRTRDLPVMSLTRATTTG